MKKLAIALLAINIHRGKQIKVKPDWSRCKRESKHLQPGALAAESMMLLLLLLLWLRSSVAGVMLRSVQEWSRCPECRRVSAEPRAPGRGAARLSVISSASCVCSETKLSPASRWAAGRWPPPPAWPASGTCWSGTPSPTQSAAWCWSWSSGPRSPRAGRPCRCCSFQPQQHRIPSQEYWTHRSCAPWLGTGDMKTVVSKINEGAHKRSTKPFKINYPRPYPGNKLKNYSGVEQQCLHDKLWSVLFTCSWNFFFLREINMLCGNLCNDEKYKLNV